MTVGATQAGFTTMQALINPGDEVIIMEPFYDAYPSWVVMAGGIPVFVPLKRLTSSSSSSSFTSSDSTASSWYLDPLDFEQAISPRTKAIILNTPHNPLGKVFSRDELEVIADIVQKHNLLVISDEVYDKIIFDDFTHVSIASLPGMSHRTVTLGSAGKTFSCTGWKIGWTIASKEISKAIFLAHQWIPFSVSTPLQDAVAKTFKQATENGYFDNLPALFTKKRDLLYAGLEKAQLNPILPQGGYFIMADTSNIDISIC